MGDGHLAFVDLGHIEDVIDQGHEMLGGIADLFQAVFDALTVFDIGSGNGGHADDGVHRRADLMTHAGKEILLGRIGILRVDESVFEHLLFAYIVGLVGDGDNVADDLVIDDLWETLEEHPAHFAGRKAHLQTTGLAGGGAGILAEGAEFVQIVGDNALFDDLDVVKEIVLADLQDALTIGADVFQRIFLLVENEEDLVDIGGQNVKKPFVFAR